MALANLALRFLLELGGAAAVGYAALLVVFGNDAGGLLCGVAS